MQVDPGLFSHTLGYGGYFGDRGKVGEHVALGDTHTTVASRRDRSQVDVFSGSYLAGTWGGEEFFSSDSSCLIESRASSSRRDRPRLEGGNRRLCFLDLEIVFWFADDRHHGQYRNHLAFFVRADMDGSPGVGLHRENGFIRLHFHDRLALRDFGPILDQPFDQGHFLDRLAKFRDKELFSHQLTTFRQAARIRPMLGIATSSRLSARGIGTLAEATRTIGASSQSKAASLICAMTSLMKLVFS